MKTIERKVELLKKGVRVADIARELGLSGSHVSLVLSGRSISARVQQAIAEKIGKPVSEVFPPRAEDAAA
jgi:transcriptional regulator with XRE-family HTH domain